MDDTLNETINFSHHQLLCYFQANMAELKRSKMDLPPAPSKDEDAKLEFGTVVKPTFAQETGIRVSSNLSKWIYFLHMC